MKTYMTDGGLGHNQYAVLVRLDKSEKGYNYLVIDDTNVLNEYEYVIGTVVYDLEGIYVSESSYKLTDSPLHGTFLFDYFINNYKAL